MVKPSMGQSGERAAQQPEVVRANEVAVQLAAGRPVAPEAVARSTDVLLTALWHGAQGAAVGLVPICRALSTAEDQAELLGELVAAGPRAQPVLAELTRSGAPERLAGLLHDDEMRALMDGLSGPLQQRLAAIASMLAREARERPPAGAPAASDAARHGQDLEEPHVFNVSSEVREEDAPADGGDDGPGLASGAALSEQARLEAVVARGEEAVPGLVGLLRTSPTDREFAATALVHVGRAGGSAARAVRRHAAALEGDQTVGTAAENVRKQMDDVLSGVAGDAADAGARTRARGSNIGDGWLRRALDTCDAPSILSAAAGREVAAIPLALRRLVALRARRHAAHDHS